MIGFTKKVAVVPLQSEASATYNPFPDTTPVIDIQAIKSAFLADTDVLAAIKGDDGQAGPQGPQGNQGQAGPAGDSVIVRDTDPTDAVSSKVGDLYLNSTSGTLYQRSGITESQFYAAGLQGLVLPNSIWIRKGNLKGSIGEKGDKGDGIINGLGHPSIAIQTLPPVGTLYLNKNSFVMYERTATEYIPGNIPEPLPEDYTLGYWYALGSLQGVNGQDGENGSQIIVNNSHPYPVEMVEDLTNYTVGSLAINSVTFAIYKRTANFVTIPVNQQSNLPDDYTNGYWELLGSLKGGNGSNGTNGFTEVVKGYFNFSAKVTVSAQARKTGVTPSTSMGPSWDSNKYVRNSLELIVNNKVIVVSEYDTAPAGGMLYALNDYIAYLHVTTGELYFSSTWEASGANYPVDSGRTYVKYLSK